jgi:hypothetical protein
MPSRISSKFRRAAALVRILPVFESGRVNKLKQNFTVLLLLKTNVLQIR